jgi:hypothetical protein
MFHVKHRVECTLRTLRTLRSLRSLRTLRYPVAETAGWANRLSPSKWGVFSLGGGV